MHTSKFFTRAAALLTVVAWACAPASADVKSPAGVDSEAAVWAPHDLTFVYKAFTTHYNCDSLRSKVKGILLQLGARPDIQVRSYGCTQIASPDPLPGVSVKMHVLKPAAAQSGQTVSAHWKTVNLVVRDPTDAAGECELIDQIRRDVLPLFTTRNVEFATTCVPRQLNIGTTELKADVLVATQGRAADTVAR